MHQSPITYVPYRREEEKAKRLSSFHRRSLFTSEATLKRQEDGPKGWLDRGPDGRARGMMYSEEYFEGATT